MLLVSTTVQEHLAEKERLENKPLYSCWNNSNFSFIDRLPVRAAGFLRLLTRLRTSWKELPARGSSPSVDGAEDRMAKDPDDWVAGFVCKRNHLLEPMWINMTHIKTELTFIVYC